MTSLAIQETGSIETHEQTSGSLDDYKQNSRRDATSNILWGSGLILLHVVLLVFEAIAFSDLFRSLLFIIGIAGFAGGIWEYYQAKRLTLVDLHKHNEAQAFTKSVEKSEIPYTKALLACLILVAVFELIAGDKESIKAAGLVKSAVWDGEVWRLLTCATLPASFMNICFIGVIGLVGFAIIDNSAHLGGLIAGIVCGLVIIKKDVDPHLANRSRLVKVLGLASLLVIAMISLFSIAMILK